VAVLEDGDEQDERPPPQPPPGQLENDLTDWADNVCNVIHNNTTDVNCKPIVATLESSELYQHPSITDTFHSSIDNIPVHSNQPSTYSNLLVAEEMDSYDHIYDPVIHAFQNSTTASSQQWSPNLNTIIEETVYDISLVNDNLTLKPTTISSGKKRRSRLEHLQSIKNQHDNRICQAISSNGIYRVQIQSAQHDGGANRSVTSSKDLLLHYEPIEDYAINGVKDGEPAITCIGKGYIPWRANNGEMILVRCLYCPNASGTILSPSNINSQYCDRYEGWTMKTDYDSKIGNFRLIARDGVNHLNFSSYSENNLWFHYLDQIKKDEYEKIGQQTKAIVRTLSNGANYELWHNRLGHPDETIMSKIHENVIGVPPLKRHKFYSCAACMSSKFRKVHIGSTKHQSKVATDMENINKGQHLHADFGYVRGSDWSKKDSDGKLVTSINGYRSYCLVIDRATRYIWIILTKRKNATNNRITQSTPTSCN
jgi:hypothetical protein